MAELKGVLYKQGVGTLGRGFKKRYFRQQGKSLLYFRNEGDKQELGRIELEEAFKVRTTDVKEGKYGFQIDTPKRIWALLADSQESLNYWVDGINGFIGTKDSGGYRQSVRYETMENRIRDLEGHDAVLKRALEIAARRLNITVEQLIQDAEAEISSSSSSSSSSAASSSAASSSAAGSSSASAAAAAPSSPSAASVESPAAAAADEAKQPASDEDSQDKKDDQGKMKRFRARVLYDYTAQQEYEMTIRVGEVITVLSKHGNGWWLGASGEGKQGYFPGSYVEPIEE